MKLTSITNPVALRRDTTVGTRIFSGNTMVYGDTGWRDIAELITPGILDYEAIGTAGVTKVRRYGDTVYWVFRFRPDSSRVGSTFALPIMTNTVPLGFRENPISYIGFTGVVAGTSVVSLSNSAGATSLAINNTEAWIDRSYGMSGSYVTTDPWPTTLPGLPT